jgi:hypothetical protein
MNVNTKNPDKYALTPSRLKQAAKASERYALKIGLKKIYPKKPLVMPVQEPVTISDFTIGDLKERVVNNIQPLIEHFAKYTYNEVKGEGTGIKSFCVLCGKNK